jgi:RNA polymerase sigma-70 factor (ECF subfamily)
LNTADSTGKLWELFREGLKSFIISRVKHEAEAEDILQDVFIRMHENLCHLKDSSKVKPWLYQVTRNLIIDHFRKKRLDTREYKIMLPAKQNSERFMDEAVSDMLRMMDKLSPEYCEALCMTEIEGISQKEYAVRAGLSYSGAKSRIQRARLMLKEMLLDCCHYQFDRYGTVFNIEPGCCRCCTPGR